MNSLEIQNKLFLALSIVAALANRAEPHGQFIDVFVDSETNQLLVSANYLPGQFVFDQGVIDAYIPEIGVTFPSNGVAVDTALELETVGGLLFWDGDVAPTSATVVIEGPPEDEFGNPVASDVSEYSVDDSSGVQTGMTWGRYSGDNFWEARGIFTLLPASAEPGVYGVGVRLNADAYAASDPFLLPWIYDPGDAWIPMEEDAAVAALHALLAGGVLGDRDNDGDRDGRDLLIWQRNPDAAQFGAWSQSYGIPSNNVAVVPEPNAILVALTLSFCSLFFRFSVKELTP